MKVAIYPGSFDPISNGHLDIIKRASKLFDKVYVLVSINPQKNYIFTDDERVKIVKKACENIENVEVVASKALVLDFAKTQTKNYEKVVDNIVNSKHDIVRLLMDAKNSEGLRLLNAEEVSDVLYKCKNVIDENPKLFKAVLKNPEEIAFISSLESKSDGIFKAVNDPLNSSSQMIK